MWEPQQNIFCDVLSQRHLTFRDHAPRLDFGAILLRVSRLSCDDVAPEPRSYVTEKFLRTARKLPGIGVSPRTKSLRTLV